MRWPSVYIWGWVMGLPGLVLCFFGSLALAFAAEGLMERFYLSIDVSFLLIFAPLLITVTFTAMKVVDCPRCGVSAYWHSAHRWGNAWPARRCSKCDLDLRKYHPFDSRAKRDPNV
ncbi:hypothetical protein [Brevundimonas sp.]|uniref:hypothetical protein n=1 Tax=Brevundimonas sp. TaxID=1871086 RepID=UPI002D41E26C|nr:hypothetical protein [Brevundimonas sp.]HYC68049.1 hypothetical protein [Brevundimonas sp.]